MRLYQDSYDVFNDSPRKEKFIKSLESIQINATLAITGSIKGTCKNIRQ